MRCPVLYQWEIFIDGELPPDRKMQMESHLRDCPSCSRLAAGLGKETELFSLSLAFTPVPPDLAVVISKRLAGARGGECLFGFFLAALGFAGMLGGLSEGWWPLFEKLRNIIQLFVGSDFALQFALSFYDLVLKLSDAAMTRDPVSPALAVLAVCVLWTQLKLQRGGRTYV
ncbi:MAG: hypothetical protein VR68_01630 [Peptococcaceae bacterium BRH_c4a]|nr:MAG: hypothetical protein VR68_01630 [Peptococcaceae bacterium BRH_c4a]